MPIRIKNSASIDPVVGLGTRIGNKPVTINEVYVYQDEAFPGPSTSGGVATVTISTPGYMKWFASTFPAVASCWLSLRKQCSTLVHRTWLISYFGFLQKVSCKSKSREQQGAWTATYSIFPSGKLISGTNYQKFVHLQYNGGIWRHGN